MMELKFITKIDELDIQVESQELVPKPHPDSHIIVSINNDRKVDLKWEARVVADTQKINSLVAHVPDQDVLISVEVESETEDGDYEVETKEITLRLRDAQISYTSEDASDSTPMGLMPISIERYRGKWSVTFCTHSV